MLRSTTKPAATLQRTLRSSLRPATTPVSLACRAASTTAPASLASADPIAPAKDSGHAISNPTLANIEKRWETMPLPEQAELWMALRDRMKNDWSQLTYQEKRASYWIAFGNHGPRATEPPGQNLKIFLYTMAGVGAGVAMFLAIRQFARPAPFTMNQEWQEATNEYLKRQRANPFTGITSEGYEGKGAVQSPPKGA